MAAIRGSAFSFILPCNQSASCRTKPLFSVSASITASFPSKPRNRKNRLRIKIRRTLIKPYPSISTPVVPQLPLTDPATEVVPPEISEPNGVATELSSPAECCPTATADGDEHGVSRLAESSNTATQFGFGVGNFSWGSVLRYGAYFLSVFAFQTICTVCVLEYGKWIEENKNSDEVSNVYRASQREVLLNGDEKHRNFGSETSALVYLKDSKTRDKIEEIRAMARAARKEEKNKISDDFGIEKEVDARLVKLQKRLNSARGKITESHVNYLLKSEKTEDAIEKDHLNGDDGNKTLMFKRKFKYRSSSNEIIRKPKGFPGSAAIKRKSGSNGRGTIVDDENLVGNKMEVEDSKKQEDRKILNSVSQMFNDDGTNLANAESVLKPQSEVKKSDIGMKAAPSNGAVQVSSSVVILKSQNSRDLEVKNSREIFTTSAVPPTLSLNDSFVGKKSMHHNGRSKQSNKGTDLWWSNLPYVLVIVMRRGSDDDGLGGLFTLKIPSEVHDLEDSTYTVAFEDRVDANNFCYLLESFFEELGDFTADIVPLPTKELKNVVKSHVRNIIVVKKGQLQLYAGQPFTDVEMALQDLVEQNESVISLNPS